MPRVWTPGILSPAIAPSGRGFRRGDKPKTKSSIKVGQIAELTGALSFMGVANANVAKMVVDEINEKGGLLGRLVELIVEDGETTDSVAAAKARKLVRQDRVDVILGGVFSSTGRRSRVQPSSKAGLFPSTRSNTRARNGIRSCSAPARRRPSSSTPSFRGLCRRPARKNSPCRRPTTSGRAR